MKKILPALFLAFCLLLGVTGLAEEPAVSYTPGEITNQLKAEALKTGNMISYNFNVALDMEDDALGAEYAADIAAVEKLLSGLTLYVAGGSVSDGLRVEIAGDYGDAANSIGADVSAMLSNDGVSLESSLIEGKRITVKWETLLTLLGVPQEQIDRLKDLEDADFEAMLADFQEKASEVLQAVGDAAAPYLGVVMEFVQKLPVEQQEAVAAEGSFPAVDHAMIWTVTPADCATLVDALADTLEQDENLPALAAKYDVDFPKDELLGKMRESAESLRTGGDGDKLHFEIGYSDDGLPAYLLLSALNEAENTRDTFALITEPGDAENAYHLLAFAMQNKDGVTAQPFGMEIALTLDPADPKAFDAEFVLNFDGDDASGSVHYVLSRTPATFDDDLPGYQIYVKEEVTAEQEESVVVTTEEASGYNKLNAQGGETSYAEGTVSVKQDDVEKTNLSVVVANEIRPSSASIFEQETSMHFAAPDIGLNDLNIYLYSVPVGYDAEGVAALTVYPVEEMDEDTQSALLVEAMTGVQELISSFSEIAPPEVLEFIQRLNAPAEEEAIPDAAENPGV